MGAIVVEKVHAAVKTSEPGSKFKAFKPNKIAEEPSVTKLPGKTKSSVKVTFYPDFKRFNIKDLKNDHMDLFHRRSYDIAGTANNKLKVYLKFRK
jgi:hypothetical protein